MRLTHKIAAALVAVLIALLAGAAFILDSAVRPGFQRLERAMHERNQIRVAANLETMADDMRSRVTDYAYWDETYAFIADGNRRYVVDLADPWLADYGVDIIIFADSAGRVLWHRQVSRDGGVGEDVVAAARLASLVASRASGRAARAGVVWQADSDFVMLSFAQATRSDGSGAPRGWVIMGKRLSATALSQQTQMGINLISAAAPGDMAGRMNALDQAPAVWEGQRAIYALTALRDPFGEIVGAVLTQQQREATALGARSIQVALLLFAALLVVAIAALWVLLRALIMRRLDQLEVHFHAQRDQPLEMPVVGDDEIARLTQAYNALVGRLSDAGGREQAARMRQEAEAAANRAKADFLTNVSHELRRPLDAIIGYTELIGEELQSEDAARSRVDLDRVGDAARRLLALIGEILDVSRIDAGRLELRPEAFPVMEMLHSLEKGAAREGALRLIVQDDLGGAFTDRRRLNQCLANTILNARQLSTSGAVTLHASRRNGMLRFEIYAPGVALTPDQLAHALDPLSGAHKPGLRLGSGLALVVTRKLLSLLGGALEVRNGADGATFVLTTTAFLDSAGQSAREPAAAA